MIQYATLICNQTDEGAWSNLEWFEPTQTLHPGWQTKEQPITPLNSCSIGGVFLNAAFVSSIHGEAFGP